MIVELRRRMNIWVYLAQHFDRFILSRPRYESEAMLNAKRNGFTVIICGENYTAADVVSTLRQRDYNAALLRSSKL